MAATQTRSNGETSQFGTNVFAGGPPPPPTADFTWSQQPNTLKVSFSATATGNPSSWSWAFGDGGTSSVQNPTWTYGAGGTYNVSLTVTNESGSQTTIHSVLVSPIPPGTVMAADSFGRTTTNDWGVADTGGQYSLDGVSSSFNVGGGTGNIVLPSNNATRGVRLDQVSVRDIDVRVRVKTDKLPAGTNGQLLAYLVTRSNGTSTYRPKIIVYGDGSVWVHAGVMVNGSESSMGNSVLVSGLTDAANKFIWLRAQVTGVNPTTVRVKAWADGTTEPANWQFTATNSAPALQVPGGVGLHAYASTTNTPLTFSFDDFSAVIPGGTPTPPVASFTSAQRSGTMIVDFTDTSTGSPTAWSWNFGDGTTSTQRNPTKTYAAAGDYSVTLTASNTGGPNSITTTVTVVPVPPPPPPAANFTFSQQSGTLTVAFTDTSTGSPTAWSWDFGDSTSSIQQSPTKTYAAAADYTVTLTATNAGGSNSITKTVSVAAIPPPPPPTANFTSSQRLNTFTVDFTDTSTGSPTVWSWDFGDGTSSTQESPSKTYAVAGDYSVTLTVTNAGGPNSITKTVSVAPIPATITVVADAFGRTTNNGWGSADTGGAYSLLGPASNFGVGGGVGTMVVPSASTTRSAMLPATSAADNDITFRVRVSKLPAGGSYFVYAASRVNGKNEYRPRILINPGGTVSAHASVVVNGSESPIGSAVVVPGLTPTVNGWIRFRAQVTGANPTTIRVKAWPDGSAEPTAWNYTATNTAAALQASGSLGLRVYLNTSVTNAPVTFGFDDYSVTTPTPPPTGSVTVLAAGDVAGCTSSGDEATAALLGTNAGTILIPGDIAYENGSTADFTNCFDPSWGAYKSRMKPVPGNHEYQTAGAAGYFGYFGALAGDPTKGYYAYNLGAWRLYALNSNCFAIGGCTAGSPEEQWLRADLAANPTSCVAAYWHHPLFSSGEHGSDTLTQALFQALYDANADLVLVGHDHDYERFAPQTAAGVADVTRGIREIVVGTGGVSHYPFAGTFAANSQVHSDDTYGLLKLTLSPGALLVAVSAGRRTELHGHGQYQLPLKRPSR